MSKIRFVFLILIAVVKTVVATDLFQADSYFKQEQYALARIAYLEAANVGSAHAFYQLGLMEYKGLGVEQNSVKALVWFALSGEQKFNDAETIVADLMALVPPENKAELLQLVNSMREQYGLQYISQKYYPLIKYAELNNRILFIADGQSELSGSQTYEYIDSLDMDLALEDEWQAEKMMDEGSAGPPEIFAQSKTLPMWKLPYSAVVDFDVGLDGSARNLQSSQEIAHYRTALNELTLSGGPSPHFAGNKVAFVNRAKLGLAGYSKFKLSSNTYERFYYALVRQARKLRKSQSPTEQYRYGLLLMTFEWLAQDENEVDVVFKKLAELDFPLAQYEYGAKLYREQSDIHQAIRWLSEASKYGVAKAQYRLARILVESPWVEKDEGKALFWFTSAADNGHQIARIKAAELKILANDQGLHDLVAAQDDLTKLAESQADNPEYVYLQAMLNYSDSPRDLPAAVEHIRRAIHLADRKNWDTTEWQRLLTNWTSKGSVTIVDS